MNYPCPKYGGNYNSFEKFLTKADSRYNHTLADLIQEEGEELFEEIVKAIKAKNS